MNKIVIGLLLMCSLAAKAQEIDTTQIIWEKPKQEEIIDTNAMAGDTNLMEYLNSSVNIPSISSPTVAGLGEYSKFPVGLNTGIPIINIPLVTLNGKQLSVPISLSYHAGGTRVDDVSSWIGLAWSLNAGGVITREVRGLPDDMISFNKESFNNEGLKRFCVKSYFDNCRYIKTGVNNSFWDMNYVPDSTIIAKRELYQHNGSYLKVIDSTIKYYDKEPDYFYFNFCGRTGRFVLTWDEVKNKIVPICFPLNEMQIIIDDSLSKFTIIDENGTSYYFGKNKSNTKRYIETTFSDSKSDNFFLQKNRFLKSAWFLTEIISSDDIDTIKFNYILNSEIPDKKTVHIRTNLHNPNVPPIYEYNEEIINYKINTYYIDNIVSSKNKIIFKSIKDRIDAKNNLENEKCTRLNEIFIYECTNNNICVGILKFHHSYFKTNKNYTPENAYLHHRLKLDSISVYDSSYNLKQPPSVFKYINEIVPIRGSYYRDYEGFDNQRVVAPTGEIPKTLVPEKLNKLQDGNAPLAGLLNTIIFPTGTKTIYEYETNRDYRIFDSLVCTVDNSNNNGIKKTFFNFKISDTALVFHETNFYPCDLIRFYVNIKIENSKNYPVKPDSLYAFFPKYFHGKYKTVYFHFTPRKYNMQNPIITDTIATRYYGITNFSVITGNYETTYNLFRNGYVKAFPYDKVKFCLKVERINYNYTSNIPRLKTIFEINKNNKDTLFTSYEYNEGNKSSHVDLKKYKFTNQKIVFFIRKYPHINNYNDSINFRCSYNLSETGRFDSPVMFAQVTEKYGKYGNLGKTIYNFNIIPDIEKGYDYSSNPLYLLTDNNYMQGSMKKQTLYSGDDKILKTIDYEYESFYNNHTRVRAIPVIKGYSTNLYNVKKCSNMHFFYTYPTYKHTEKCGTDILDSLFRIYGKVSKYYIYTSFVRLSKIITKEFDKQGGVTKTEVEYKYDNNLHSNPTRIITNVNDEYTIIERNKYLKDYDLSKFDNIILRNINGTFNTINPLVENQIWQKEDGEIKLMSANINRFTTKQSPKYYQIRVDANYNYQPLKPLTAAELSENPEDGIINYPKIFYKPDAFSQDLFYQYDELGLLKTIRPKDDTPKSFLWDKKSNALKAKVENAVFKDAPIGNSATMIDAESGNKIPENNDYWWFSSLVEVSQTEKHSGKYSFFSNNNDSLYGIGKYVRPDNVNQKFILSAWVKVMSAGKQMGFDVFTYNTKAHIEWQSINLEPTNGEWKYVQMIIDMPAVMKKKNVNASDIEKIGMFFTYGGDVYIDDVRFMPVDAQMTTTTIKQGVGAESITGADNRTTFYEYDSFGRLKSVKDQDKKLKVNYFYNIKR